MTRDRSAAGAPTTEPACEYCADRGVVSGMGEVVTCPKCMGRPSERDFRVVRKRLLAHPCAAMQGFGCLRSGSDWRTPMCPRCTAIALLDALARAEAGT